ncbi:SGNH/GDSL hydrolase family protein [Endozoicomonas lisbonensis]|uniref:SGNH hydrolase-type esterase domain-containing protein n=1 Tax=Endozoicomonas lisbonensis TaxID=3120522 RepID=A0ABV2SNN4_9GAMM
MHRQVSGNTSLRKLFKSFMFFCLLSPSILYATGKKDEIAFVGASITAGAGELLNFNEPSSHYFELIRYDNSFSVSNQSPVGNSLGLLNIIKSPVDKLAEQIKKAVQRAPKMIITIDGLFWVVYKSEKDALQRLEKALTHMTQAKQNFVISLLPVVSVPLFGKYYSVSSKTINDVNKRLKEWSQDQNKKHPNQGQVLLLDLTSYFGKEPGVNCGRTLGKKTRKEVMPEGQIHPTKFGHLCLTGRLLEELSQSKLSQFNLIASHFNSTKLLDLPEEPSQSKPSQLDLKDILAITKNIAKKFLHTQHDEH